MTSEETNEGPEWLIIIRIHTAKMLPEHCQTGSIDHLSRKPVFDLPLGKEMFPSVQSELSS